ncbi:hypothetical protein KR018_001074 [Drosophila ironensis]|nr:hypothetical protein KR018_001074 [Drosophila ironensis]
MPFLSGSQAGAGAGAGASGGFGFGGEAEAEAAVGPAPEEMLPRGYSIRTPEQESEDEDEGAAAAVVRPSRPRRRSPHTLPQFGVDEHVTQPLLWLGLEALDKAVAAGAAIRHPQFVAEYIERNITMEVFKDGNGPHYGPFGNPSATRNRALDRSRHSV